MGKSWYVIHTYAGFEQRVRASIQERANQMGLSDKLGQVLVPTEEVVEVDPGASGDGGGGGGGGCSIAPGGSERGGDPSLVLALALVLAALLRRARLAGGPARPSGRATAV